MRTILLFILMAGHTCAATINLDRDGLSFQQRNYQASELLRQYAEFKKMNIVFDPDFKDYEVTILGRKTIRSEHIEQYVTAILFQEGYIMTLLPDTATLKIINHRDVRYQGVPTYTDINKVPDTYEHIQFMHQMKHIPSGELARNLRPIVGRYGRVIDHTNTLIVSDTAKNIRRIMKIVHQLDTSEHLKSVEEIKQLNEKNKTVISKGRSTLDIITDYHVLFLLVFALIGGILGFGVRGYMMKRIEGGW